MIYLTIGLAAYLVGLVIVVSVLEKEKEIFKSKIEALAQYQKDNK